MTDLLRALAKALQLAEQAEDAGLDPIDIDGITTPVRELWREFQHLLQRAATE